MDSTESIPCENQFHRGIDSREGNGGGEDPRTKSIPALKINILWDMADSIPYLALTQFQQSCESGFIESGFGSSISSESGSGSTVLMTKN
jgi:hypothetical protein